MSKFWTWNGRRLAMPWTMARWLLLKVQQG